MSSDLHVRIIAFKKHLASLPINKQDTEIGKFRDSLIERHCAYIIDQKLREYGICGYNHSH